MRTVVAPRWIGVVCEVQMPKPYGVGMTGRKTSSAGELAVGDRLLVEVVPPILGVDNAFGHAGGARRGVDQEDVVGPGRGEAGVCQAVGPGVDTEAGPFTERDGSKARVGFGCSLQPRTRAVRCR